jgi:fibronectin-binding autotransporter adhesin
LPYTIVTNGSGFSGILTLESTGLTDNATSAETISGSTAVSLNATQPWTLAGGTFTDSTPLNLNTSVLTVNTSVAAASATFSGALSGSGAAGLTKSGSGSLLLTGTSSIPSISFQGGTSQISTGTLTLTATTSSGFTVGAGSVTINNDATVDASATGASGNQIDGPAGATVTVSGSGSQLKLGNFVSVGYTSSDTGSLTIQQNASVSGGGAGGTLYVGTFGTSSGTLSITSGGSLAYPGVVLGTSLGTTGSATVDGSGSMLTAGLDLYIGGQVATGGSGTLTITNGGSVVAPITEFESNTSTININGGTLATGALQSLNTGNGAITLTNPAGGFALTINGSSGPNTYSGSISGTGSLQKSGGSTQNLSGANTFTGLVFVTGGTLNMSSGAAYEYEVASGGNLALGFGNLGSSVVFAASGATVTLSSPILSGGFLEGLGTYNISSVNNIAGTTIENGTTITPAAGAALSAVTNSGTINNPSGQVLFWFGGSNAGGTFNVSGTTVISEWTSSGIVQVNSGGNLNPNIANMILLGGSRTYVGTSSSPGGSITLTSGDTIELNGGLLVNYGTVSGGTVDVNFGGLATGTGSYSSVVVNPGGTYSPGTYSLASALPQSTTSFAAIQPASSGLTTTATAITANASAIFTVNGTDSLTLTSPLTTNNNAVQKLGTGAVSLPAFATTSSLSVSAGTMQLGTASNYPHVLQVGALTVSTGATLDLTNNNMIVHNGTLGTVTTAGSITNEIAQGRGTNGLWTGSGISSSSAAATPSLTALGVELNNNGSGGTLMTSFEGQTVTSNDVLVKYTFVGDADLSGKISSTDYVLIDNGFNSRGGANPLTGWRNGDFNYDGKIDGDDYTLIDNAFNTQGSVSFASTSAGPAEMIAADTAQIALSAAVPEPGTLGLLAMGAVGLLIPKRRNRRLVFHAR